MAYKHKLVEGLAQLIDKYAGKGHDPFTAALWFGIKGQVPYILRSLDESEEAIAEIQSKLMEVLDIKPPESQVTKIEPVQIEAIPEPALAAEVEITVVPAVPEEVTQPAERPPKPKKKGEGKKKRKVREQDILVAEMEATVEPAEEESNGDKGE